MHADGAGTKSSLAYVYWKETGDLSVWKGIAQDAIVMNLDDLLCVGITDNILLSSTIGRNKQEDSRRGNIRTDQWDRRNPGRTERPGSLHLQHRRGDGRCGRPGKNHHRGFDGSGPFPEVRYH
jgi:hypothetical protein